MRCSLMVVGLSRRRCRVQLVISLNRYRLLSVRMVLMLYVFVLCLIRFIIMCDLLAVLRSCGLSDKRRPSRRPVGRLVCAGPVRDYEPKTEGKKPPANYVWSRQHSPR